VLDIRVEITGDKIVLAGLQRLGKAIPRAVDRGLERSAMGLHRAAMSFLSGGKGRPGGYPIPMRTGHLRRSLDWLGPNRSKSQNGMSFATGPHEALVYNSAVYSRAIHDGRGSSAKFGARPFLTDAFEQFNRGNHIAGIIEEEISDAIAKEGLA